MSLPLGLRLSCCHVQACCNQLLLAAFAVADLAGVKAGQRRAQDLHEVACLPQGIVHVVVVGVRVVAMPVQYVRAHFEGVAGDVGRRVAHAVELVPQDALGPAERGLGVWMRCSAAACGGATPLAGFLRNLCNGCQPAAEREASALGCQLSGCTVVGLQCSHRLSRQAGLHGPPR